MFPDARWYAGSRLRVRAPLVQEARSPLSHGEILSTSRVRRRRGNRKPFTKALVLPVDVYFFVFTRPNTSMVPEYFGATIAEFPIELVVNARKERSIVAARDLPEGTLIMRERPLAYAVLPALRGQRCEVCFARSDDRPLSRCIGCSQRYYCSKVCQRAHWVSGGHRSSCKLEKRGRSPHHDVDLALSVLRRHGESHAAWDALAFLRSHSAGAYTPSASVAIDATDARALADSAARDEAARTAAVATERARAEGGEDAADWARVEGLIATFQANNFAITSDVLSAAASGIFPAAAMLNHSCDPTCVVTFDISADGREFALSLRTVRPVDAGAELTHAYVDIAQPTAERRMALWIGHRFYCRCARCSHR